MIDPHQKQTEQADAELPNQLRVITNQATVIANDQTSYVGGPRLSKTSFVKAVFDATGQAIDPNQVSVDLSNINWDRPDNYRINLRYANPGKTVSTTAHLHLFSLAGRDVTIHAGEPLPVSSEFVSELVDPGHPDARHNVQLVFDEPVASFQPGNRYGAMLTYTVNGITAAAHQVLQILPNLVSIITANQTTYVNGPKTNSERFIRTLCDADGRLIPAEKAVVDMSAVDWNRAGRYPVEISYTDHGKSIHRTAYENIFELTAHNQIIVVGDGDPIPARYVALARDQNGRDRTRWTAMTYLDPTANHQLPGTYDVRLSLEVNGSVATVHPTLQVLPEILRPLNSTAAWTMPVGQRGEPLTETQILAAQSLRHSLRHTSESRVANNAAKVADKLTWWQRIRQWFKK